MRLPLLVASVLALTSATALAQDRVVLEGWRWQQLLPPDVPGEAPRPGPYGVDRRIAVIASPHRIDVAATFEFDTFEPGWLEARLFEQRFDEIVVLQDGGPAAWDMRDGAVVATSYVDGPTTFEIRATLHQSIEHTPLQLEAFTASARAALEVQLPEGLLAEVQGNPAVRLEDGTWAAHGALHIEARPEAPRSADRTDLLGESALGLTVGDSVLTGRARLRWVVLGGRVDRVSFLGSDLGDDLTVTGTGVGEVTRSGDRVSVALTAPVASLVELDLAWTTPLPKGTEGHLAVPTITLEGARRTIAALQLARDGEWEALPSLTGWTGRSGAALPVWGRGLVAGTPTATFTAPGGGRGGTLSLLRYEPVSGPAAVVDVADYLAALSVDGRSVVRARYEVRNDRATELSVRLPVDVQLLSVRVRGEAARFTRGPGEAAATSSAPQTPEQNLRIPLPRSVETVEGMISFPVEVAWLSDGTAWERRDQRTLSLPRLSAPVAVARVTLHLPPGYAEHRRHARDDRHRVDDFTKGAGISYGFKVTDEEDRERAATADLLFQSAVDSWMDNDFDKAQETLDELNELGASNDNTVRLQSNIHVVTGEGRAEPTAGGDAGIAFDGKDGAGESMKRRVREQARARADDEFRAYESSMREAEKKERTGDYAGAEMDYRKALELGEKLEGLDQDESSEMEELNFTVEQSLSDVRKKKKEKRDRAEKAVASSAPVRGPLGAGSGGTLGGFAVGGAGRTATATATVSKSVEGEPSPQPIGTHEPARTAARAPLEAPAAPPSLRASTRSVLIPTLGQTVRFQQLLLPADGVHEVIVRARLIP